MHENRDLYLQNWINRGYFADKYIPELAEYLFRFVFEVNFAGRIVSCHQGPQVVSSWPPLT
jgi:hypothetical protein